MTAIAQTTGWGESVARHLLDSLTCPVCASRRLSGGCCTDCGADLRGASGAELWAASEAAAAALRARNQLIERIPRVPAAPAVPEVRRVVPAPNDGHVPAAPPVARSSASVQSVLAIAGAGLFAIAALIFTYLNPDLSDRSTRTVVVGLATLMFSAGAWLLARRGLQFSAESVGALGLVFVMLDVHSFAQLGADPSAAWLRAGLAMAVASTALFVAGRLSRIRVWSWFALLGASVVPAFLSYAAPSAYVAAIGHIGTAFVAAVFISRWPGVASRSLTATQVIATLSAVPAAAISSFAFAAASEIWMPLSVSLVLVLVAAHAVYASRNPLRHWWSLIAGGAATTAFVLAVNASVVSIAPEWLPAALPTAAAFGFALLGITPLVRTVSRFALLLGGLIVVLLTALVPVVFVAKGAIDAISDVIRQTPVQVASLPSSWAALIGVVGIAAGLALFGRLSRERNAVLAVGSDDGDDERDFTMTTDALAVMFLALAFLGLACSNLLPLSARLAVVLGAAVAAAVILPRLGGTRAVRGVLLCAVHAAVVVAAVTSWGDPQSAPLAAIGILSVLALASGMLPSSVRFVHVGFGFTYALICLGQALAHSIPHAFAPSTPVALSSIAVLCLVASAALVVAIIATFLPRIGSRNWYAVLVVTTAPFVAGIVQVVFERSGWTALSTSLMFALALSLLLTRRPGLDGVLRVIAGAMLVPTVAVVVVCLGAQILAVSASPVTLPVIATIVALVLPSTTLIRDGLIRNGLGADAATAVRIGIEASALLTGAIATGLALAREAAGLGTTFLVLVILGVGSSASAAFTRRRYGWWVSGATFTGALWCVWTTNGVDLLEAYLLPPAVGAMLVAVLLAARGARIGEVRGLFAAGVAVAIVPSLALVIFTASDARQGTEFPWRAVALLVAGGLLLGVAALFTKTRNRVRLLAPAAFVGSGAAALAGPLQGMRIGFGPHGGLLHGSALFFACFAFSAAAGVILMAAGRGIRRSSRAKSRIRRTRWLYVPAVLAPTVGTWGAIERDWGSIWLMWTLMIAVLAVMLIAAIRAERTALPPVWLLFAVAFVTAVVAWSPRDLRVEWFSLPLGAFLLASGIHALRAARPGAAGRASWPLGRRSSWALLAPGLVTMMSASIVATFTDPLTWRAILVMVLALAAILVGASRQLAAPFLLGMLVLPIENVFVFAVQIGRGIESMPWWITLALIGAVLLIIAVTYERRSGEANTMVARLRDLR